MNPRKTAIEILSHVEGESDLSMSEVISRVLEASGLSAKDRGLATEISYGVERHRLFLDYVINPYLKSGKVNTTLRRILRAGVYQILFCDRIPSHAAVNEMVSIARNEEGKSAAGFINAILRKVSRMKLSGIELPDREKNLSKHLSVKYSFPLWIVNLFLSQYGIHDTKRLLEFLNQKGIPSLRINRLKISKKDLIKRIKNNHPVCEIYEGDYSPDCLIVKNLSISPDDEMIKKGWVYFQDEAAQLISCFASPSRDDRIIDYCCAPGGKLSHLAALTNNNADLVGLDVDEKRLQKTRQNCERLGVRIQEMQKITKGAIKKLKSYPADIVLVDAPCSGLGIIRRNPDIKWKKTPATVDYLKKEQSAILKEGSALVKPGGALIYSTCTLTRDENERTVEEFLKTRDDFVLKKTTGSLPENAHFMITERGYFTPFPPDTGTDGMFAAILQKVND